MAFRTMNARYAGKCRRCKEPITVGSKMRYGGRGLTYHLARECPGSESFGAEAWGVAEFASTLEPADLLAELAETYHGVPA